MLIETRSSSSRGSQALVVVVGGGSGLLDAGVAPEAVAADLASLAHAQLAHLLHGLGELAEEPALVFGEAVDEPPGAAVEQEPLVGGEHPLPLHEVLEVHVVEGVRRPHVQVLLPVVVVAAEAGQPVGELVVGAAPVDAVAEGAAARLADGVGAGERDEVGGVTLVVAAEALVAEAGDEGVDVGVRAREGLDGPARSGLQAVAASHGHGDPGAAGLAHGVGGGERQDVGARHGGPALVVHGAADALDEVQRLLLQALVLDLVLLAVPPVQQDGRVATLREAVVEEDAEEAGGDLRAAVGIGARGPHGGAHHAVQVGARQRMEVNRQDRSTSVVGHRLQRQRQRRRCGDEHGQEDDAATPPSRRHRCCWMVPSK
uniref:Uncharacterized protein n=1 Tax=Setaria italica TaxID=4555 RepID=K3Z776_SETIT